jgi:hypothetical protein
MANAFVKIPTKHVIGSREINRPSPIVTDQADVQLRRMDLVAGDTVILSHQAQLDVAGVATNMVLTGYTALRATIRSDISPTAVLLGRQTTIITAGADASDVATGLVNWYVAVGPIGYAIAAVSIGSKTFTIQGSWPLQFVDGDTFTISGSTGNDGSYTINGTPVYTAATNITVITVDQTPADATVDGTITHSAMQSQTFATSGSNKGTLTAYVEYVYLDANSEPQTLMPAFECRILNHLDDGDVGQPGSSSVTYLTSSEIAALYFPLLDGPTLNYAAATELTIATGAITVTQSQHAVDTEADAASDDLDTISGGTAGDVLYLVGANAARVVTLKHGTGNITSSTTADVVLPAAGFVELYYDGTNWQVNAIGSGDVSAGAAIADNAIARGDGGGKGIQTSGVTITDVGQLRTIQATDEASATTTDLGAIEGNYVSITGTTTITGLGTVAAGVTVTATFAGILTLTHNGTSLILPTAANITTAAGDSAVFVSLGSGNWRCVAYTRADGTALAGSGGGGTTQEYIPASAMVPRVTNGAAIGSQELATNDVNEEYLLFDSTTEEFADFWWLPPSTWDAGTVTAVAYWDGSTGATAADTVEWEVAGRSYANDDARDQAAGTGQVISDALLAVGDEHITSATPAITIAGTPTTSQRVRFTVSRNVAGTDDMAEDAKLFGIRLNWTNS